MKKCSSIVWQFFDRLTENNRCVAVLCKLCDTEYKYFGNTTNLRQHLINKHPIQWELTQNGTLNTSSLTSYDDNESNHSAVTPKRRYTRGYKDKNVRYSISVDLNNTPDSRTNSTGVDLIPKIEIQRVDVLEHSETENDHNDDEQSEAAVHLVRQLHGNKDADEEWLEDDAYQTIETYEPKQKRSKMKYKRIKREVESPSRRSSSYFITTPKYEKQERFIVEDTQTKDEYSVFGEYVANKLRKFQVARTRGNLQQLITTILWQAEYGMYDNADSVKRILMSSIQEPELSTQEHELSTVTQASPVHTVEIIDERMLDQSTKEEKL